MRPLKLVFIRARARQLLYTVNTAFTQNIFARVSENHM